MQTVKIEWRYLFCDRIKEFCMKSDIVDNRNAFPLRPESAGCDVFMLKIVTKSLSVDTFSLMLVAVKKTG